MLPEIPGELHGIASGTFAYCFALRNDGIPTIPNSVVDMCGTFAYCRNLTTTPSLPNAVINIAECFMNCSNITSAGYIPNSVTNVRNTFAGCNNLTGSIYIQSNKIGDVKDCFANTSLDKNVYIPFTYENGVNTKTYNTFINAGYSTSTRKYGALLKDINAPVIKKYIETDGYEFTNVNDTVNISKIYDIFCPSSGNNNAS